MLKSMIVPSAVMQEVEAILATVPGTVFYDAGGNALILGDDHTFVVRIVHDTQRAYTEEAYLATQPVETLIDASSQFNGSHLPELKGFEAGFTC